MTKAESFSNSKFQIRNRWIALSAGLLIQTVMGGIYAWSTFSPWMVEGYGLSEGQWSLIFGVVIGVFTSAMVLAGRVLIKKGPRFTAAVGVSLFMVGYVLASFSGGRFPFLLLSLGGLSGVGIGFCYVCPLSVGLKWFPKKKGLVTGIAVAGFGGGAILLSSVAGYYLQAGVDVLIFFRWFGLLSGICLLAATVFLNDPPDTERKPTAGASLSAILTVPFGVMALGIFSGTFAGLLVIGNLTPLVIQAGLSGNQAVASVAIFAVGNAVGRIVWGQVFDHFNYKTIPLSLVVFALFCALLLVALPAPALLILAGLLGFGFGANFVIYASGISRYFGVESFPRLYPICFLAYGAAGIIGPGVGGYLADLTGSYNLAIYISIGIVSLAAIVALGKLRVLERKRSSTV